MLALALVAAGCAAPTPAPAATTVATPAVLPATGATPAATANASGTVVQIAQKTGFGLWLVDGKGMTLYMFTKDTPTTSACYAACATLWPPFTTTTAPVGVGARITPSYLGTLKRTDGKLQVTYDGHPLYYYSKDQKPGDINGQAFNHLWFVVSPRGNGMMGPYSPAAATATAAARARMTPGAAAAPMATPAAAATPKPTP
jgi:predicted lipoprotein with Yx(FWY)xxD motif